MMGEGGEWMGREGIKLLILSLFGNAAQPVFFKKIKLFF